uniref:Uncharacterized protein n=1 Tax=Rangifer tarandus platyrhynchus TaxID=3082113 RepID=A0ACB0EGP9_RANTA|nr:unnamed protein product [Rangifer tarandus platyrhynchus]
MMFSLARNALSTINIEQHSIQKVVARKNHLKYSLDFHDTFGNAVVASRTIFCVVI